MAGMGLNSCLNHERYERRGDGTFTEHLEVAPFSDDPHAYILAKTLDKHLKYSSKHAFLFMIINTQD